MKTVNIILIETIFEFSRQNNKKNLTSGFPKKILEICSGTSWIESRDSGLLSKPLSCPFAMTGSEELKFVCPTPCAYLKDMTQTFSCPFGKFLGVG